MAGQLLLAGVADPEEVAREAILAVERGLFVWAPPVYDGPAAPEVAALLVRIRCLMGCKLVPEREPVGRDLEGVAGLEALAAEAER